MLGILVWCGCCHRGHWDWLRADKADPSLASSATPGLVRPAPWPALTRPVAGPGGEVGLHGGRGAGRAGGPAGGAVAVTLGSPRWRWRLFGVRLGGGGGYSGFA